MVQLPKMDSARSCFPSPMRTTAREAPPMPTRAETAETNMITGKHTPRPVRPDPHPLDVADVHPVHDVVQGVHQLGGHRGQGQPQQQRPDGVAAQVIDPFFQPWAYSSPSKK